MECVCVCVNIDVCLHGQACARRHAYTPEAIFNPDTANSLSVLESPDPGSVTGRPRVFLFPGQAD